ncbi:MAG: hypothetical protein HRU21_08760, partial [Pseudomonadales bacterium]|nr:hypothetical protein [Pseudomonadales bacterium]
MADINTSLMAVKSFAPVAWLSARLASVSNQHWRIVAYVLLLLWLINILAAGFWQMIPSPSLQPFKPFNQVDTTIVSADGAGSGMINIKPMQTWYLFGQPTAAASAEPVIEQDTPIDAQETKLSLRLMGVMQSSNPKFSHAIIEYQSKSELYQVDDALPIS